jgi:homoserine dehydrogenase
MLLLKNTQLATVNDVYNAASFTFNATDNVLFYGKGAGKNPTAGAVVSDISEVLQGGSFTSMWTSEEAILSDFSESVNTRMVRIEFDDEKDARASVEKIFERSDLIWLDANVPNQIAFYTPPLKESECRRKLDALDQMQAVNVKQSLMLYTERA